MTKSFTNMASSSWNKISVSNVGQRLVDVDHSHIPINVGEGNCISSIFKKHRRKVFHPHGCKFEPQPAPGSSWEGQATLRREMNLLRGGDRCPTKSSIQLWMQYDFLRLMSILRNWWILVHQKNPLVNNGVLILHLPNPNRFPQRHNRHDGSSENRHAGPSILCCECSLASWPQMQVNLNDRWKKKSPRFHSKKKGWGRDYRIQL